MRNALSIFDCYLVFGFLNRSEGSPNDRIDRRGLALEISNTKRILRNRSKQAYRKADLGC